MTLGMVGSTKQQGIYSLVGSWPEGEGGAEKPPGDPFQEKADLPWVLSFQPQLSPPSIYTEGHMLKTSPGSKA